MYAKTLIRINNVKNVKLTKYKNNRLKKSDNNNNTRNNNNNIY